MARMRVAVGFASLAGAVLAPMEASAFEPAAVGTPEPVSLERLLTVPGPAFPGADGWLPAARLAGSPGLASASPPPPGRLHAIRGWAPALLLGAATAVVEFAVDPPKDPRWTAVNGFDDAIRDGLRGGSRSTRDAAGTASDVLLGGMAVYLLGDWYWLRDEYGGWESARTELPWILANELVTRGVKFAADRERPYVDPCALDPDYVSNCGDVRTGNTSFYSGHTATTASLAGMICARHLHRLGRSAVDWWACGGAVAGAFTTGMLRIAADQHYATDVLAGWLSGAVFGYFVPSHFLFGGDAEPDAASAAFTPLVGPELYGLRFDLRF
jgi:membrane-associated phospholipid phosphatase